VNKQKLMFLTSENGGLAHYVVHLWKLIADYFDPVYVTYKSDAVDELLADHVGSFFPLIEPADAASIYRIVELVDDLGISYVNLHSGSRTKTYKSYYSALLRTLSKKDVRIVIHLHDVAIHDDSEENLDAIREFCHFADGILVGSSEEMHQLGKLMSIDSKIVKLMRHGPYTLINGHNFSREFARREMDIPIGVPVILSFGALRKEKGLQDLIDAFAIVRQRFAEAVLLMQSNDKYTRNYIKQLIVRSKLPGIRLSVGYAPIRKVELLFKAADTVVLPYERTAASGVLNLARAFSCPVVISDSFEQAASIDGVCGLVVPSKNTERLADALCRIIALSDEQRRSMGACWCSILDDESWENAVDALLKSFYERVYDLPIAITK